MHGKGSIQTIKARFQYEHGKKHSLFVLLLFFALASISTARFNRRSIKETKNALFHARCGNGPFVIINLKISLNNTNKRNNNLTLLLPKTSQ